MTGRGRQPKRTGPPPDLDKSITKDSGASYRVLGYQLPLNAATELDFTKHNQFFPFEKYPSANPLRWHGTPATLRERDMIAVLDKLTDKPDWERKVYDDGILAKWREECLRIAGQGEGFSNAMFDHVGQSWFSRGDQERPIHGRVTDWDFCSVPPSLEIMRVSPRRMDLCRRSTRQLRSINLTPSFLKPSRTLCVWLPNLLKT